jgi:hypothetical protein
MLIIINPPKLIKSIENLSPRHQNFGSRGKRKPGVHSLILPQKLSGIELVK